MYRAKKNTALSFVGRIADGLPRPLRGDTSGSISIEMAFLVIVLLVLAVGAMDFGRLSIASARMASAARAGTQYGIQDLTQTTDFAGMIAAARADAVDAENLLTVNARQYCSCASGGEVPCGGVCDDGGYPPVYVEVSVQDALQLFFSYPGVARTQTVGATNTLRAR